MKARHWFDIAFLALVDAALIAILIAALQSAR